MCVMSFLSLLGHTCILFTLLSILFVLIRGGVVEKGSIVFRCAMPASA